jgi:hypothetical protein
MFLAGIFPAKQTQQKVIECSEFSSSIIRTHKTPLQTHNYFPAGFQRKKIAKFYGDVSLVLAIKFSLHLIPRALFFVLIASDYFDHGFEQWDDEMFYPKWMSLTLCSGAKLCQRSLL